MNCLAIYTTRGRQAQPPARGKSQVLRLLLLLGNLHAGHKESVERMPLAPRTMNGPLNQAIMRAFVAAAKTYANYKTVAIVMKMRASLSLSLSLWEMS